MEVTTIEYTAERGWSEPFPEWDSPQTLVIAFGAPEFGGGPGPLRELLDAYRESHVLGCSTAGEISGDQVSDGSIVAAICRFDEATLRSASARCETPEDSFDTGQRIGADLAADDLRAVFVLSDGLGVNGSELARGLAAAKRSADDALVSLRPVQLPALSSIGAGHGHRRQRQPAALASRRRRPRPITAN